MTAIVLYPILVVRVPGMGDYLNHLARMHILSHIGRSEALRNFYRVQWQAIPYLAMDATFVVLNHITTIYNAAGLHRHMHRASSAECCLAAFRVHRRLSIVPVAAFLFCYNSLLSSGFLNYLPALYLAVMVFAGWIASAGWPRWPRAALFCMLALGLYFSHLVAFGVYCLMVGAFELAGAWRAGFQPWRVIAADWFAAGLQALPAIAFALSVEIERPFVGPIPTWYGGLWTKLSALGSPVVFFGGKVDILTFAFAGLLFLFGLVTRRLRLSPTVWPVALAVAVVAICMPNELWGTWGMDFRLPLLVVMLIIGGVSLTERMGRSLLYALVGAVITLTIVRSASIAATLRAVDVEIAEVRDVVAAMPRGMRLMLVDAALDRRHRGAAPLRATLHAGMVAVIDRDAFVPNLFTGLSTVHPTPALLADSTPSGPPLRMSDLAAGLGRSDDPAGEQGDGRGGRIYWMGWERKFDYVLVVLFGVEPAPLPSNLRLVAASSIANLYRIIKP